MNSVLKERYLRCVLPTYLRHELELVRGKGARVWDAEGREYLDFCMGIAVCSLGHCPPELVSALAAQAEELIHVSNLFYTPQQGALAEEIVAQVGSPGRVFFSNSGAEANDGLIKVARRYGHARPQPNGQPRYEILTCTQSFHGRTLGALAATGQSKVKEGFEPLLPGFKHLTFNCLEDFSRALEPATVAVLIEPVQGEGGVHVAEPAFLRGLATLCQEHDLLLFFDEVQAGFGRCGDAMAWRRLAPELVPDGISWAKGMGGGVPIGAFWLRERAVEGSQHNLPDLMGAGSHGSTYGGNPLVAAASLAVLRAIRTQGLAARCVELEASIRAEILSWQAPAISEVRGLGLLLGLGLEPAHIPAEEGKSPAQVLCARLLEAGLLTVPAGPSTVRLLPPLNISDDELAEGLGILQRTLRAIDAQKHAMKETL